MYDFLNYDNFAMIKIYIKKQNKNDFDLQYLRNIKAIKESQFRIKHQKQIQLYLNLFHNFYEEQNRFHFKSNNDIINEIFIYFGKRMERTMIHQFINSLLPKYIELQ